MRGVGRKGDSYTDEEGTQECSWQSQFVLVGDQHTPHHGGCITGKRKL